MIRANAGAFALANASSKAVLIWAQGVALHLRFFSQLHINLLFTGEFDIDI